MNMTRGLLLGLLLLPGMAWGVPSSQFNLSVIAQTEVVNVRTYGAVCDGATDDYAAFNSALTAFVQVDTTTAVSTDSTFDGYTLQKVVRALRVHGLLA